MMETSNSKKKKILWASDFCKTPSGFGKNAKAVLSYLYATGKYEIIEFACAPFTYKDKRLSAVPWRAYGAMPEERGAKNALEESEYLNSISKYGGLYIDDIIEKERPDIYIGVNDFWAFDGYTDKPWWNKVNCAIWATADSLPLYKEARENAHKIKNLWVWSKFAENEFKRLGHTHVKTIPGAIDTENFKPLDKLAIKKKNNLDSNTVIVGFVFRNQLRKLVGTLIEAFSIFKNSNPNIKAKLLLHTNWVEEGKWDIPSFLEEYNINNEDVLATYVCNNCGGYSLKPFITDKENCQHCGSEKSQYTVKSYKGVSDPQMNEIYNVIDYYVHPVTSGGLEMPIVESLMAGTPVATVNYSCGEEFCEQPFVDTITHTEYRECQSQFKKAQPSPNHIAELIKNFCESNNIDSRSKDGSSWASERFNVKRICGLIEDWIDSCPEPDNNYSINRFEFNPSYPFQDIEDTTDWCIDLIKGVLNQDETKDSQVIKKLLKKIEFGDTKENVYKTTTEFARKNNTNRKKTEITTYFENDTDKGFVAFISPPKIEQRLACLKFVKDLCENEKVYIVADEVDEQIYLECGSYKIIPKSSKSIDPIWLSEVKNKNEEFRFKKVIFKNNKIFDEINN